MNLVKLSSVVRKSIIGLIGLLIFYVLYLFILKPVGQNIWYAVFPPKDLPTPIYGQLDPLQFDQKSISNENPVFVLNTKNGKLPTGLPNKMTVYKFVASQFSYQAGKNAQDDAAYLGFTDENLTTDLKGEIYSWRNPRTNSLLEIKIHTRELLLSTPLTGKTTYFSQRITETAAIQSAKNMFKAIARFNDKLYVNGKQTVTLGKYVSGEIVPITSPTEAVVARVDLFREINKYPILGPDPSKGLLHTILRVPQAENKFMNYPVVEANYWELETTSNATYPIISVSEAWGAISGGKGVVANVTPKDANLFLEYEPVRVDRILIDNIYLAYFERPEFQMYLQPIYVFKGSFTATGGSAGEITLYFPAITGQWIKPITPTNSSQAPN